VSRAIRGASGIPGVAIQARREIDIARSIDLRIAPNRTVFHRIELAFARSIRFPRIDPLPKSIRPRFCHPEAGPAEPVAGNVIRRPKDL
jgi:hypothetical protein